MVVGMFSSSVMKDNRKERTSLKTRKPLERQKSPGTVLLDSFCEWKKSTRSVPGDF